MEALRLDGNAAAGLLSEVFAAEVATAADRPRRSARSTSTWRPELFCVVRTARPW